MVRAGSRQRLQWRNALVGQRVVHCADPTIAASLLRMRKLPQIERGDWRALVEYVRDITKLKTGPLAERVGISPETWWRWERRGQRPKEAHIVERFAKAFGLETDDAMWAAGMLIDEQATDPDPRLTGLDPNDAVVSRIMSLDVSEPFRSQLLSRYRRVLEARRQADLEEIDMLAERERGAA